MACRCRGADAGRRGLLGRSESRPTGRPQQSRPLREELSNSPRACLGRRSTTGWSAARGLYPGQPPAARFEFRRCDAAVDSSSRRLAPGLTCWRPEGPGLTVPMTPLRRLNCLHSLVTNCNQRVRPNHPIRSGLSCRGTTSAQRCDNRNRVATTFTISVARRGENPYPDARNW